jgi:hypothetical protein
MNKLFKTSEALVQKILEPEQQLMSTEEFYRLQTQDLDSALNAL